MFVGLKGNSLLPCCSHSLTLLASYADVLFFFHSFIGCSSSDRQYKFVIQHTHTHTKKKKRSKNLKGVGATGLTSHARHRP